MSETIFQVHEQKIHVVRQALLHLPDFSARVLQIRFQYGRIFAQLKSAKEIKLYWDRAEQKLKKGSLEQRNAETAKRLLSEGKLTEWNQSLADAMEALDDYARHEQENDATLEQFVDFCAQEDVGDFRIPYENVKNTSDIRLRIAGDVADPIAAQLREAGCYEEIVRDSGIADEQSNNQEALMRIAIAQAVFDVLAETQRKFSE